MLYGIGRMPVNTKRQLSQANRITPLYEGIIFTETWNTKGVYVRGMVVLT
jgi:hypothetical protein